MIRLTFCFFVLGSLSVYSQASNVSVGFNVGRTSCTPASDGQHDADDEVFSARKSTNYGGFVEYRWISLNVSHFQKGGYHHDFTYKSSHLSIAIVLRPYLKINRFEPYLNGGLRTDRLLHADIPKYADGHDQFTVSKKATGLLYGIGLRLHFPKIFVLVEYIEDIELTNSGDARVYNASSGHTRFGIGYKL